MQKSEILEILLYIYADFDKEVSEEKVRVWHQEFSHVPKDVGWLAARYLLHQRVFGAPRVADFSAAVAHVGTSPLEAPEPSDAWAMVSAAASSGTFLTLPELVQRVAFSLGSALDVRSSTQPELRRASFVRDYKKARDEYLRDKSLPIALREQISALQSKSDPKLLELDAVLNNPPPLQEEEIRPGERPKLDLETAKLYRKLTGEMSSLDPEKDFLEECNELSRNAYKKEPEELTKKPASDA